MIKQFKNSNGLNPLGPLDNGSNSSPSEENGWIYINEGDAYLYGTDKLTVTQADTQGARVLYRALNNKGDKTLYLVALKEDRSIYGGYMEIEEGTTAIVDILIHASWNPEGGRFIIGVTDYAGAPNRVKFIGKTILFKVVPDICNM